MNVQFGPVTDASGAVHPVVVRHEGVFVRPSDGVVVEQGDPSSVPLRPSPEDTAHMITLPLGALAIEVTEPMRE